MFWKRSTGRSDIFARDAMVASSQPIATQAGLEILQRGGNAVDAAISTAAVLDVVEPFSTGCGGDAFALIHIPGSKEPVGFNGSGRSGSLMQLEDLLERGWSQIPVHGGAPVTVPGAMHMWATLIEEYGQLEFKDVLQPAIRYARDGFPVSPVISQNWNSAIANLRNDAAKRLYSTSTPIYPGRVMRNPDLAVTLELIAEEGVETFYRGEIAERIVETVQSNGGFITGNDMAIHTTERTTPISIDYRGFQIYEHAPNCQGFAALVMLGILNEFDFSSMSSYSAERYHILIEAKKLAYADLYQHNADPEFYSVPIDEILSPEYLTNRASLIDPNRVMCPPLSGIELRSDTVYLCTADSSGTSVSLINSLYMPFGSGLVVPGTGIKLQNRGHLFNLDESHPNCYAPKKRPFHTIIPGAIYKDDDFFGVFGIMGGDHQAQAHGQFISNVMDFQMGPQQALDHPRFHHDQTRNTVAIENGISPIEQGNLRKLGHNFLHETMSGFGGGQAIFLMDGIWVGGSDHRKDGQAAGF